MSRRPRTRSLPIACALLAVPLTLAACGPGTSADVTNIKQTITGFSAASGASSCDYLSTHALQEMFAGGGAARTRAQARAACAAQSAAFKGEPATISRIWFQGSTAAEAYAKTPNRTRNYLLYLRKSGDRWLINQIQH